MMDWKAGGFINVNFWAQLGLNYSLQPTPIFLQSECLRIYLGVRDNSGVSRVMYIEVNPSNPSEVYGHSKSCGLDIGSPGMFDDNGVVPTIARRTEEGSIFLYYAGYQIPNRTKFLAFGGLAISTDNGENFERFSKVPVMDRCDGEEIFRVPHSMLYDSIKNKWQVWYGAGNSYRTHNNLPSPSYDIRYCESNDGITFSPGRVVISFADNNETRVGRPYVTKDAEGNFEMYFAKYNLGGTFRLAYADSKDGIQWRRNDSKANLKLRSSGEDSNMSSYPATYFKGEYQFLLYNGNEYGKHGICWAYRLSKNLADN
jgi:hypothetical protein